MKNKTIGLAGIAVLMCSASALAQQPPQARGTMTQAVDSNVKNQAKNPDSPGLPNAFTHVTGNAVKHELHQLEKAAESADRGGADHGARVERVEQVERVERPERVERVERPERAERPERVVRAERPEPPGRAKK
jgi:hypothetical protein